MIPLLPYLSVCLPSHPSLCSHRPRECSVCRLPVWLTDSSSQQHWSLCIIQHRLCKGRRAPFNGTMGIWINLPQLFLLPLSKSDLIPCKWKRFHERELAAKSNYRQSETFRLVFKVSSGKAIFLFFQSFSSRRYLLFFYFLSILNFSIMAFYMPEDSTWKMLQIDALIVT